MFRALACFAVLGSAAAFVPSSVSSRTSFPERAPAHEQLTTLEPTASESSSTWTSCMLAGMGIGYAAAVSAAASSRNVARKAEKVAAAKTPVAYPIFTF
eukprot:4178784-Amphidinium_carterae.1